MFVGTGCFNIYQKASKSLLPESRQLHFVQTRLFLMTCWKKRQSGFIFSEYSAVTTDSEEATIISEGLPFIRLLLKLFSSWWLWVTMLVGASSGFLEELFLTCHIRSVRLLWIYGRLLELHQTLEGNVCPFTVPSLHHVSV